ncbi:MAG: hypothetical protein J7515_04550 [Caulobacter sp.]|nr:hypothetical protein [Caulobacter sp.]
MRIFLYILGFLVAGAVAIVPWFLPPITFITVLMCIAGVAMIVLLIVGLVKGWGISLQTGGGT